MSALMPAAIAQNPAAHFQSKAEGEPAPIDFYFDFSSPYGYFMAEKIDELAAAHGRRVTWRPVLLFAVLRALNMPAPLEHPIKRAYMFVDFERSANFLGVDYHLPASFPAVTQHAARAFYLLFEDSPETAVRFARAVLRAYWCEGREIGDIDVIAQMVCDASSAGAPASPAELASVCDQLRGDAAKALLQQAIAGAIERQVFGSPFVIVDGERFFGADRLPQIEMRLAEQAAQLHA